MSDPSVGDPAVGDLAVGDPAVGVPAAGAPAAGVSRARALVDAHERQVPDDERRARGVHYTPSALATLLVQRSVAHLGRTPTRVADPACGSGAFLLAAADELHRLGVDPAEVVRERLTGLEIDAEAVAVCRRALVAWAAAHGATIDEHEVDIVHGDAFAVATAPARRAARPVDLIVGNPPFLGQLAARSARESAQRRVAAELLGSASGYADTASLFLLDSIRQLQGSDGVVCLVQPQSFLAARDTARVRAALLEHARLVELWGSDELLFDASVRVCAPILRLRRSPAAESAAESTGDSAGEPTSGSADDRPAGRTEVIWGLAPTTYPAVAEPVGQASWGPLLAGPRGIPAVPEHRGAVLGDVATATAGFRDEFYALTDHMVDPGDDTAPRLVTVGMIDVAELTWGRTPRRVRKAIRTAPRVDLAALAAAAPKVAEWTAGRLVPKVLVATQTRVVEAVADPLGDCVPVTPTISVEPRDGAPSLSHLVAALSAPPVAAAAAARHLGTGLSAGALRWSARSVLEVALPTSQVHWDRGAELVGSLGEQHGAGRDALLEELGRAMTEAHGLEPGHPVFLWWRALLLG